MKDLTISLFLILFFHSPLQAKSKAPHKKSPSGHTAMKRKLTNRSEKLRSDNEAIQLEIEKAIREEEKEASLHQELVQENLDQPSDHP